MVTKMDIKARCNWHDLSIQHPGKRIYNYICNKGAVCFLSVVFKTTVQECNIFSVIILKECLNASRNNTISSSLNNKWLTYFDLRQKPKHQNPIFL